MSKFFYTLVLCILTISATAQDDDSLFVVKKDRSWVLPYTSGKGETVFMIARRFHVPPAVLGTMNGIDYKSTFPPRAHVTVPIAAYNFLREKPGDMTDALPLYYKIREDDDLLHISRLSGVSQQVMERWNMLPDNNIYIDQVLFVGWILYDATSGGKRIVTEIEGQPKPKNAPEKRDNRPVLNKQADPEAAWPGVKQNDKMQNDDGWHTNTSYNDGQEPVWHDTVIVIKRNKPDSVVSPFETLYLEQTNNEVNAATEKGTVAFFNSGNKENTVYYAFHSDLQRGVIIKVHNPGTDRTIYAKVIGALPATKQYYNCVMALSGNAKEELGVHENKAWCEISHR